MSVNLTSHNLAINSVAESCPTICDVLAFSTAGFLVQHQIPELAQIHSIELVMQSNHLILCRPLLLLPSIFPSIRVFSNESVLSTGGQSIWVSASVSVLPINIQDWFPLGLTGLISLQFNGLSRFFSNSSVQFTHSVMSDSLQPHESQHTRPPCPSPTPGVYSNSCPSSWWCQPAISSSVVPFSSSPNPSKHQGLLQWVNSSHKVAKVLEFQLQHQSHQWTLRTDLLKDGLVGSPCSPRDSQESSPTHSSKASIFQRSAFFTVQLSHPYMTTGQTIAFTRWTFVCRVMSLLFNMLSRLVITFLTRNFHAAISWLQSPSAVILEPKKIKSDTVSTVSRSSSHEIFYQSDVILEFICHFHCIIIRDLI